MVERESGRLILLKQGAEAYNEKGDHDLLKHLAQDFLQATDLSEVEKSWGLYFEAMAVLRGKSGVAAEEALKKIKQAIGYHHIEPEFFTLKALIHLIRKDTNEAIDEINRGISLTKERQKDINLKRLFEIKNAQATTLLMMGNMPLAIDTLSTGLDFLYKSHVQNSEDITMDKCLTTYKDALSRMKQRETDNKIAERENEILKLKEALEAAKIVDNPEQINEDFTDRISTSAARLVALRKITERNSKNLTFFVTLVILSSLSLQLFVPLISDLQEPSPYFYITVTTGTILIVSSIFYQLRQANHNERVELHLHEDLQRKKTLMLYATSITTEDRVAAQKQIIDHFDYRGTPEQLADLYHKGKGQPKADDQLEKIAQAIKDIPKNQ